MSARARFRGLQGDSERSMKCAPPKASENENRRNPLTTMRLAQRRAAAETRCEAHGTGSFRIIFCAALAWQFTQHSLKRRRRGSLF
jgi:hypothetical protein